MPGLPDPPDPPEHGLHVFGAVAPVVGWLFIIAGWWVVHWTSIVRARRQEDREAVKELVARVGQIRDSAIVAIGMPRAERVDATLRVQHECMALKSRIDTLSAHRKLRRTWPWLRSKFGSKSDYYNVEPEFLTLRDTVTGDAIYPPQDAPDRDQKAVIVEMYMVAEALVVALQNKCEQANVSNFFL